MDYINLAANFMDYSKPAGAEAIQRAITSLEQNGIEAELVSRAEIKEKVLGLIPDGSEVLQATSVTLEELGIAEVINTSGKYDAIKPKLATMSREEQNREMQRLGAAPEFVVGSVHAVTEDGKVVIASNSGSQIPSYAYGADKVIWVVGTQKIVPDLDTAFDRIYKYTLPLESERAHKAYGVAGSFVSKILIFNRETKPGRITLLFVDDSIGF